MNVTGQFDAYFPSVEKNSRTWMNIHAILHHARHAYVHHQSEHAQLEEADFKISNLKKKKLRKWRNIWKQLKLNIRQK